jgi:DNA-binding response OmpR family regulator
MRLLLIEDDAPLAEVLRFGLTEEGFAVDGVGDAADGLRQLSLTPYDALVLDLGLPGSDGLTVLSEVRRRGSNLPVLILTARTEVSHRVAGLDAGADDYLTKPFALAELSARIRALLRRGSVPLPSVLRYADVDLDPAAFVARRSGKTLALTAKEFSLLHFFMRHAERLVTRSMLLDHCWDKGYQGVSNLVDVHVGRLRRKLDAPGGPPLLHTLRGAGFLLATEPR